MEFVLTRNERELVKDLLKEDARIKRSALPQLLASLAGGLLVVAPLAFMIGHLERADEVVGRIGTYLAGMVIVGVGMVTYSAFLVRKGKDQRDKEVLVSAVRKIVDASRLSLD